MQRCTILCLFALSLSAVCLPKADASDPACTQPTRSLFSGPQTAVCKPVTIDMTQVPVRVPRVMHVPNNAQLTLKIRHVVTDKCSVGFQAASITSADPLAAILGVIVGLKVSPSTGGALMVLQLDGGQDCSTQLDQSLVPKSEVAASVFEGQLQSLAQMLTTASRDVKNAGGATAIQDVKGFVTCTPKTDCSP